MSLDPLLTAALPIRIHAAAAFAALATGAVQLVGAKGTRPHRALGFFWVAAMYVTAISSFWVHTIKQFGDFSLIHGLSVFAIVTLPLGIIAAHQHDVGKHKTTMLWIFVTALMIPGLFTLVPGRIMHAVVFGGP